MPGQVAVDAERLKRLHLRHNGTPVAARPQPLFPAGADPFFRAERVTPQGTAITLAPAFSVLVVHAGTGTLSTEHGDRVPLRAGETVLLPFGCGKTELSGDADVVRCRPPGAAAG